MDAVVDYIEKALLKGIPEKKITDSLLDGGWSPEEISKAFWIAHGKPVADLSLYYEEQPDAYGAAFLMGMLTIIFMVFILGLILYNLPNAVPQANVFDALSRIAIQ